MTTIERMRPARARPERRGGRVVGPGVDDGQFVGPHQITVRPRPGHDARVGGGDPDHQRRQRRGPTGLGRAVAGSRGAAPSPRAARPGRRRRWCARWHRPRSATESDHAPRPGRRADRFVVSGVTGQQDPKSPLVGHDPREHGWHLLDRGRGGEQLAARGEPPDRLEVLHGGEDEVELARLGTRQRVDGRTQTVSTVS